MRLTPGSVAHLQHLAGLAWAEGNLDEAERLEALARAVVMMESRGRSDLTFNYTTSDGHRIKDGKAAPSSEAPAL